MDIVVLEPDDAEYVADLAAHHYPPTYPMSVEDIAENLERGDKTSFCFGVEAEEKILGYLMAWIDNTMVEGRRERVLLVDDIVLSTRARHQLFRLLDTMIKEMQKRGYGKLPIEGSARPTSSHTFMGHPEALERLGYELASKAEYHEEEFGEDLTWVRYEAIEETDAEIDTDDFLEIEFEPTETPEAELQGQDENEEEFLDEEFVEEEEFFEDEELLDEDYDEEEYLDDEELEEEAHYENDEEEFRFDGEA